MDPHVIKTKSGFTLIELLVAMLIMMVGLLGLLQTINYAFKQNLSNLFRNEATALAGEKIADMTAKGSGTAFVLYSTGTSHTVPVRRTLPGNVFKWYSVATSINSTSPTTVGIDVTVSWTDKQVRNTTNASTFISQSR